MEIINKPKVICVINQVFTLILKTAQIKSKKKLKNIIKEK